MARGKPGRPAGGPKTGGRKKGTPNKLKTPETALEARAAAAAKRAQELNEQFIADAVRDPDKKTPLEIMLDFMRDESYPPGFRGDMAKAAAPYIHSKAPDASPPPLIQITQIERLIVRPKRRDDDDGS